MPPPGSAPPGSGSFLLIISFTTSATSLASSLSFGGSKGALTMPGCRRVRSRTCTGYWIAGRASSRLLAAYELPTKPTLTNATASVILRLFQFPFFMFHFPSLSCSGVERANGILALSLKYAPQQPSSAPVLGIRNERELSGNEERRERKQPHQQRNAKVKAHRHQQDEHATAPVQRKEERKRDLKG